MSKPVIEKATDWNYWLQQDISVCDICKFSVPTSPHECSRPDGTPCPIGLMSGLIGLHFKWSYQQQRAVNDMKTFTLSNPINDRVTERIKSINSFVRDLKALINGKPYMGWA